MLHVCQFMLCMDCESEIKIYYIIIIINYGITFPEIINFWSYSPLHSMLSMLISVLQLRTQMDDTVLNSDNVLVPVLMYEMKGNNNQYSKA